MVELSSMELHDELRCRLLALNIEHENIEFIRTKGTKFINDPGILSLKCGISIEQAKGALRALGSLQNKCITKDEINSIEKFTEEHPMIQSVREIALYCEIDEELVTKYLESIPLSDNQRNTISDLFNTGHSINDIAYQLKLESNKRIQEYVNLKFITFSGEEGQRILEIIHEQKDLETDSSFTLREMIKSRNLKLQDQLCCILPKNDEQGYEHVRNYFKKFDESTNFFELDIHLTIDDILFIKDSNLNTEKLSIILNKTETVIRNHLTQYCPNQAERNFYVHAQKEAIEGIVAVFGKSIKTFHEYRTIVTESFDNLIKRAEKLNPMDTLNQLLPLIFYYLKCSLSFKDITLIIAKTCKITLTTYDIFHLIFQLSEPVVRGLCIELYSFSKPVPFHYPILKTELLNGGKIELNLCTELWYSIQEYHGLVSFGLGRASWNPIGKSHLLDLIFETDFVEGNPQNSAFHLQSIDIQMTKNLFGGVNTNSTEETTKWAYIDCHSYSDPEVIKVICQHSDIVLINVNHLDYLNNNLLISQEIEQFDKYKVYLYVFIRDYDGIEVKIQRKDHLKTYIFLPNLTKEDMTVYSVLKTIGYEILHLRNEDPKLIGTEFMESVMTQLKCPSLEEIQINKKIIQTIIEHIKKHPMSIREIDFSFLSYYPSFMKYMNFYYQANFETDREIINDLNVRCVKLKEFLENIELGEIALAFNDVLERNYSDLLLWKLSQELSSLTKQVLTGKKDDNNYERYSIEILWREALLSSKYGNKLECKEVRESYIQRFARNFSNHVERGGAFELIDGDNLRFFNKDINSLLSQLYGKQFEHLSNINRGKKNCMRQAPIVVSIVGPQSSGKSTLLNYCFGCKFLTSAGRCTKGIYASLVKLSQPINHTNQFLILDTEGLDGRSKRGSLIHFDRTMVLFCLAVSQVVIINIKGELGEEMQNMLQICAYSLNKLRVSKVVAPKIFFVLNQQADPDPNKHLNSMNNLLYKMNEQSDLIELEGSMISDLIQVSKENLIILTSAFNSVQMNMPAAKLFDSNVVKLSPTIFFANRCAELRQSIINQLIDMPLEERTTFNSMGEWLEMSGLIWETIIGYQDIVKYRNLDEMKSYNSLKMIVSNLMRKHINHQEKQFDNITKQLTCEIKSITKLQPQTIILEEKMLKFDDVFKIYHEQCLLEFDHTCQNDELLRKMTHICEEMRSNLARLIYIERKIYKDKLKIQIQAILTEITLSDNMGRFQGIISQNKYMYSDKNQTELKDVYEEIWEECFSNNGEKEENNERDEDFDDLYTVFKMESKIMENKRTIHDLMCDSNFDMDKIIQLLQSVIQDTFERKSISSTAEDFIYPCMQNNILMKEMIPFTGETKYEYLDKDTLFHVDNFNLNPVYENEIIPQICEWVPECCHSLVNYCSGYYNHADITWGMEQRKQILLLASLLRDASNFELSTWKKLVQRISSRVQEIIECDPDISQGTVKQLLNFLFSTIKHVNYEINYIQARLTIGAERTLTTLVFVYAFKSKWGLRKKVVIQSEMSNEEEKNRKRLYFIGIIERCRLTQTNVNRKGTKLNNREKLKWSDREEMRMNDRRTSNLFALDFLDTVKREVMIDAQSNIEKKFKDRKEELSHREILLEIEALVTKELESQPGKEILDQNNLVFQFICNRNGVLKIEFNKKWEELIEILFGEVFENLKTLFTERLQNIKVLLITMLQCLEFKNAEESRFDVDSIFKIDGNSIVSEEQAKECLLKSAMIYLQKYLDPNVNQKQLQTFLNNSFKVDGVKIKKKKDSYLCDKSKVLTLDDETFKKLTNIKIFNSVQIFNIHQFIKEFISTINGYQFEFSRAKLEETVKHLREEYTSLVINCPFQCPSCGKLCESELHPHSDKCQLITGHQICSMGGKVWENDDDRTAILFMCDEYDDHTLVQVPGQKMNWRKFKENTGEEWDWNLPNDRTYKILQENNREKMKKIWDKFGRGILDYHATKGVNIKYIPYTTLKSTKYCICFVIDGTGSMRTDIDRVRVSVSQLISIYEKRGSHAVFRIVIYRDHCDGENIIEQFPSGSEFTKDHSSLESFLNNVIVNGGGDYPEAVLDGLATATTNCNWTSPENVKNVIIHIYDAPPHGNFPNYKSHSYKSNRNNCCCCNNGTLCHFDWKRDVWDNLLKFNIEYNGISTGRKFLQFEAAMKTNLRELCGDFQLVGKETVNDAILSIFIDYEDYIMDSKY